MRAETDVTCRFYARIFRRSTMKTPLLFFAALLLGTALLAAEPLRQRLNFNREWKFQLGDVRGAEAVAYDDSKWNTVGLPHSFSTPYFQGKDLAGLDKLSDKELDDKFVQAECLGEFTRPKVRDGSEYFNIGQRKFWEYDVILRGPDKSSMMHKAWAGTAKDGKTVVITIDPHGKKYTD